jgi:hypothetical protein
MARVHDPTPEEIATWNDWVRERPAPIREMIEQYKFDPWTLYLLKTSGHRVTLYSFDESKEGPPTLKVYVSGDYNAVAFERRVFGIKPEDLEECDLPPPGTLTGSLDLDPHEAHALAERIRHNRN